ncbi:MAG: maleylpyruvate isomerase N-terminal domain-containing protein [Chloroflexi bacterium]|nr:maleylpyruvate isomerase N-terminal domain-containing protein [Chloroflexota bacterium]
MSKEAYKQAARFFVDTVARVQPTQWDDVGLGEWNVRDLVGHTSRSLTRVEEFCAQPADKATVLSAAEHYRISLAPANANEEIAARGREAGAELGDDPAATVRTAADRVLPLLDGLSEDMVISYPNGAIRLGDYLETRVVELTVHTLDLANAIGADAQAPTEALSVTLHLLADLAVASGQGAPLVLAATGRGLLPDRFSLMG